MTGAVTGWSIPVPRSHIGNRLRSLMTAMVTAGARRQDRPRRTSEPYYPALRDPMFEEAAMQREMYRL
jgi:hypothetical protein